MDELMVFECIENLLFDPDFDFLTSTIISTGEEVDYDEYVEDITTEADSVEILDFTDLIIINIFFINHCID